MGDEKSESAKVEKLAVVRRQVVRLVRGARSEERRAREVFAYESRIAGERSECGKVEKLVDFNLKASVFRR